MGDEAEPSSESASAKMKEPKKTYSIEKLPTESNRGSRGQSSTPCKKISREKLAILTLT